MNNASITVIFIAVVEFFNKIIHLMSAYHHHQQQQQQHNRAIIANDEAAISKGKECRVLVRWECQCKRRRHMSSGRLLTTALRIQN